MKNQFGEVNQASITILVDNQASLMGKSTDTIQYFTKKPLLAEHGFAALVDLPEAGMRILWDAGITSLALLENMKRMEIDPRTINAIALSHGHDDHTAGVTDLLRWMELKPQPKEWEAGVSLSEALKASAVAPVPVIAHPAAFRERWFESKEDGKRFGPLLPPPRAVWEAFGAQVILSEEPYRLSPGCFTTGTVPRLSFEASGRSRELYYRQENALVPDDIEDDQALVMHVKDKGLVILAGCAHSGIVNTIQHARKVSGVERVHAVLGGFHLARAKEEEIQLTVEAIQGFKPELIVPSHYTGFEAQRRLA